MMSAGMTQCRPLYREMVLILSGLIVLLGAGGRAFGEPSPAATSTYDTYVGKVEVRLAQQHRTMGGFLASVGSSAEMARLQRGELVVDKLAPANGPEQPGAMLHHWRATAFVPGATAADFERLMKDLSDYPKTYAPQVVKAKVISGQGDHLRVEMRVKEKHVITVVMDTAYDVEFGRLDARHGYSVSRSRKISEIDSPGTKNERVLTANEEHGFLWRQNTYWSYEERDGGLYMQIESVSLTRSIPSGLAWAVKPLVESVPLESLEFTLQSTFDALKSARSGTQQVARAGN
jgi:hypothetical protein